MRHLRNCIAGVMLVVIMILLSSCTDAVIKTEADKAIKAHLDKLSTAIKKHSIQGIVELYSDPYTNTLYLDGKLTTRQETASELGGYWIIAFNRFTVNNMNIAITSIDMDEANRKATVQVTMHMEYTVRRSGEMLSDDRKEEFVIELIDGKLYITAEKELITYSD